MKHGKNLKGYLFYSIAAIGKCLAQNDRESKMASRKVAKAHGACVFFVLFMTHLPSGGAVWNKMLGDAWV